MKISMVASSASSRVGIALRQKRNIAGAYSRYKSPQAWESPALARTIISVGSVVPGVLIRPGVPGFICDYAATHPKLSHLAIFAGLCQALAGLGLPSSQESRQLPQKKRPRPKAGPS